MNLLNLPERLEKHRTYGITSVVDFGVPIGTLTHILDDYHRLVDFAKIGIGSAYITPNLKKKIELYRAYGVETYCGGTLFEKCYHQNQLDDYLCYLKELGLNWVEISTGILDIPLEERLNLVRNLKKDFHVLAEVGSKDAEKDIPVTQWNDEMAALLEAGCHYVVTEGRGSGTCGIYHRNGEIKADLIFEMIENIDTQKVIFEAPSSESQAFFINHIGANVNLGNIKLNDILTLEAQRLGLRSETFHSEDDICKPFL